MAENWQNRIIGLEWKPANQLLANPKNPRRHPIPQREALRGSLESIGWYDTIIENRTTGELIDGHARVEEALTKDETMLLPVLIVEMSEHEQDLALAGHDWITSLATYDRDQLDTLLQAVNTDNEALQTMLAEQAKSFGLYDSFNPMDEWVGMPEYENGVIKPFHSIIVHFKTFVDLESFAELIGQTVTDKTRYIYHPVQKDENLKQYIVMSDES